MQTSIWHDGMMGLVVGDALGVPVEFKTREEIKNSTEGPVTGMRGHGTYDLPAGTWSDDSSLALATLCGLKYEKRLDPELIMHFFTSWHDRADFTPFREVFDEGRTCKAAIEAFKKDEDIKTCGVTGEHANGNGALMRILPVCLYVYEQVKAGAMTDREAIEKVHEIASLTHNHRRSNICCGVYYFLIKAILTHKNGAGDSAKNLLVILQEGLDQARAFYGQDQENMAEMEHLQRIWHLSEFKNTPEDQIKSSGYVIDTLEAALWCLANTDSYAAAVLMAVNLGNDTDTVGSVTGGLAGLFYGYDNIPVEWRDSIKSVNDILNPCDVVAGIKFSFGYKVMPYREEMLRRLKVKHRWVTMELMNSIARLEIEQIDGQYEFVKYYTSFGRPERQILNKRVMYYNTARELLDILTRNIADELVSRNKITATYKVRFTTDADPGGWRLERYEINRHESGDYSLFQQAGDRNTGGYRIDMINPQAFMETDYSEFLKWIPHCGIKHEDLLADEGLKAFVGYDKKEN